MGEKGTDRQRGPNGAVFTKRGHVRVIKNSNMNHGQVQGSFRSLAASPIKSDGKGSPSPDSFVSSGSAGSAKKGKRSVDLPSLSVSPTTRNGAFGGNLSPKNITPRSSPSLGCHYAGAKFSEPPSPDALPKPPMHWAPHGSPHGGRDQFFEISQQLKMMLKVQA